MPPFRGLNLKQTRFSAQLCIFFFSKLDYSQIESIRTSDPAVKQLLSDAVFVDVDGVREFENGKQKTNKYV